MMESALRIKQKYGIHHNRNTPPSKTVHGTENTGWVYHLSPKHGHQQTKPQHAQHRILQKMMDGKSFQRELPEMHSFQTNQRKMYPWPSNLFIHICIQITEGTIFPSDTPCLSVLISQTSMSWHLDTSWKLQTKTLNYYCCTKSSRENKIAL